MILELIGNIFFYAFCACFALFVYFLLMYVRRLAFYKAPAIEHNFSEGVSVVICARNEALNLRKHLPFVLNQKYPNFEVVVVDDGSSDATEKVLAHYAGEFSNLRIVRIDPKYKEGKGKKYPLSVGIKNAKYEYLLMTDADCYPRSERWIQQMANGFAQGKEIVLGYGKYERRAGFLNQLVQWDTFFVALQYFSFALAGKPYMGVGRNLAYTKSLFEKVKGFESHRHIMSGDDDLFVMEAATKNNVAIVVEHDAHTVSRNKENFKEWYRQKCRHLTTGSAYKKGVLFRLSMINFIFLLWPLLLLGNVILHKCLLVVFVMWLAKISIQYSIFKFTLSKLTTRANLILSVIFGNVLMFLSVAIVFTNLITKKDKW